MTLAADQSRCQGRTVRAMGGGTLAVECCDCQRRTQLEPGQSYQWMQPPVYVRMWMSGFCSGRIAPAQADDEVIV